MDYVMDIYFYNNNELVVNTLFIYDDERFCAKLYIFFKIIGLIFYISSLLTCHSNNFFIGMLIAMFLSTINSIRYEYAHYKRYRTTFSSLNEFKIWKKNQYPKSRIFFSSIEIIIKIIYFNLTFPTRCEFNNLCEIGECIFKIHVICLLMIYIIFGIFSMCLLWSIHCIDNSHRPINIQSYTISSPVQILVTNNNEECCICMHTDTIQWSMLLCGHKFHKECITIWLRNNRTCPICRIHV